MSDFAPMDRAVQLEAVPYAPPSWRQLGLLVLDGSGSMTTPLHEPDGSIPGLPARSKAEGVDGAVRDLLNRMKASRKASNFSFGFVSFHTEVSDERPPRDVTTIDPGTETFDPTASGSGGTMIASGLERARVLVEQFFATDAQLGVPLSAVVIVMSDGACGSPQRTLAVAEQIKQLPNTSMACCYFADMDGGGGNGPRLLQAMASAPTLYQTVFSAEQLRKFFLASMTAAAQQAAATVGDHVDLTKS